MENWVTIRNLKEEEFVFRDKENSQDFIDIEEYGEEGFYLVRSW